MKKRVIILVAIIVFLVVVAILKFKERSTTVDKKEIIGVPRVIEDKSNKVAKKGCKNCSK